jgi:DNA polymerase-3 subunit delta'
MLKTLEEPAAFVHLILLTDRLVEVLPTIRSRCQLVRFEPPSVGEIAAGLVAGGCAPDAADACARLSLGDASRAAELAGEEGSLIRVGAERFAQAVLDGRAARDRPWVDLLRSVRARGDVLRVALEASRDAELELVPRKERKRIDTDWTERIRRARRRTETGALDLGLQLVSLWFADLLYLSVGADELVRNTDRRSELSTDGGGPDAPALRLAIEHVEDTRQRFQLNVSEELACEALAYRLERTLST